MVRNSNLGDFVKEDPSNLVGRTFMDDLNEKNYCVLGYEYGIMRIRYNDGTVRGVLLSLHKNDSLIG